MAYKTLQVVSVQNLKLFATMKTEFQAKEFRWFFIMLYGKMGCMVGILLSINMAATILHFFS